MRIAFKNMFISFCIWLTLLYGACAVQLPNPMTNKVVNVGAKVMQKCAADDAAVKKLPATAPILECLRKEGKARQSEADFPAEIWESLLSQFVLGQETPEEQRKQWNGFKTHLKKAEEYMDKAIDATPMNSLDPNSFIVPPPPKIADLFAQAISAKPFKKLFDDSYDPVPGKMWSGKSGVAQLVTKEKIEYILKAVRSPGKDKFPPEFGIHETLAKLKPTFIPALYEKGFSKDDGHTFAFMVMQYVGISVGRWMQLSNKKLRPTLSEAILMLKRSFGILEELHAVDFAHNDCQKGNWALSRTSTSDLYLMDFGRSVNMKTKGDYGYIATDFMLWTDVMKRLLEVVDYIRLSPKEQDFVDDATDIANALAKELRKVLFVHPDDKYHRQYIHYAKISRGTLAEQLEVPGIASFVTMAKSWLTQAESMLKSTTNKNELTRWTPQDGESRRKRAAASQSAMQTEELVQMVVTSQTNE